MMAWAVAVILLLATVLLVVSVFMRQNRERLVDDTQRATRRELLQKLEALEASWRSECEKPMVKVTRYGPRRKT